MAKPDNGHYYHSPALCCNMKVRLAGTVFSQCPFPTNSYFHKYPYVGNISLQPAQQPFQPAEKIKHPEALHACRRNHSQQNRRHSKPCMGFFAWGGFRNGGGFGCRGIFTHRLVIDFFLFTILPFYAVFRAKDCQLFEFNERRFSD